MAATVVLSMVYIILTLLATIGNTAIFIAYYKWRVSFSSYKVTYVFLLSLTAADLFISVLVLPLAIISVVKGRWIFGDLMCTINGFVFTWLVTVTILTVLIISFHRSIVVYCPFKRIINMRRAKILSGFVWLVSLIVPLPPLLGISHYEYSETRAFCRVRFVSKKGDPGNIYSLTTVTLFVMLPLVIICVTNIALYRVSLRMLKTDTALTWESAVKDGSPRRLSRTNKGELKAFATVTLVMGIFVLCWAPQIVLTMVGVFTGQPTSDPLQTLQALCVITNTACNPFIYIYANKEARKRVCRLLCCIKEAPPFQPFINQSIPGLSIRDDN